MNESLAIFLPSMSRKAATVPRPFQVKATSGLFACSAPRASWKAVICDAKSSRVGWTSGPAQHEENDPIFGESPGSSISTPSEIGA